MATTAPIHLAHHTSWPLDDGLLPEWKEFLDRFPDFDTAVAAAEAGEKVEVFSDNDHTVAVRQRVLATPGGPWSSGPSTRISSCGT